MVDLLSIQEVAPMLRRSVGQLRWMRERGDGPKSAKLGGRIFYRREDVEKWINDQFDEQAS